MQCCDGKFDCINQELSEMENVSVPGIRDRHFHRVRQPHL